MGGSPCDVVLLSLVFFSLSNFLVVSGRGGGEISDNAYRNILVNVDPGVAENDALLERIEASFEETSKFLYRASGRRFYLGEITIMLPSSWSHKDFYEEIGQESGDHQDFIIRSSKDSPKGDVPYVVKLRQGGCGESADYVHLTTGFFLNDTANSLQLRSKTLVHEWAHLRYGVYDEYPTATTRDHFYSSQEGKIEATRCSDQIDGEWYNIETGETGENACKIVGTLPEAACRFIPYNSHNTVDEPYGSLMGYHFLSQVNVFCSDDARRAARHNTEAPTDQNNKCNGKSIWEVIQEHRDYPDNPPRTIDNVKPTFRIVRRKLPRRIVLLLDVSGSMREQQRIEKLRQGAYSFINKVIEDDTQTAVMLFNHNVEVVKPLTVVNDLTRIDLINSLPTKQDCRGATAIYKGIREAIKVSEINSEAMGANIVVVTDGYETENEPPLSEIRQEVSDKKVVVHSVAITQEADQKIDVVANQTGGMRYLFAADSSKSLYSAFKMIGESLKESSKDSPEILKDGNVEISRDKPVTEKFHVDQQTNRNLLVVIEFTKDGVKIELESPNSHRYDQFDNHFTCREEFLTCEFFHETPDVGLWSITFSASNTQKVTYTVQGESSAEDGKLEASAFWNKDTISIGPDSDSKASLQVLVEQNYSPVEDAKVTAAVQLPEGGQAMITLADDGIGADSFSNDGIYSANFIDFTSGGARYSAEVFVEGTDSTVINKNAVVGLGARAINDMSERKVSTGLFTRSTISQSIKLESFETDPSGKIYPPDRIRDLTLVRYNENDYTVTLEWTAVGAQLLLGKASEYELRYGPDSRSVRRSFAALPLVTNEMLLDDTTTDLLTPGEAKSRERVSIALPKDQTFYSFGVIAVDKDGRVSKGEVSNTVAVSFVLYKPHPEPQDITIPIIVSCIAFIVLIGIIIGLVFFVMWKLRKQKPSDQGSNPPEDPPSYEEEPPAPPRPPPYTESTPSRRPRQGVQVMMW